MTPTFDLLESPWIPCIQTDGTPVELGLREALVQAHELRALHGESPLVTVAFHRLLLAVLHRVFEGPTSWSEWGRLWEAGRWDEARLNAYLDRWRHRFDLFDPERPFYQAPDERVEPKPLNRLVHEIAHGNNPTLFDHHIEEESPALTPAQAARALVAIQAFGLGGLSGLPQKYTDAPCAGGVIFLVQGKTLFETLALNLLDYSDERLPGGSEDEDRPVWEMDDPFTPERSVPLGYLDYLTWQNRRILFLPEASGDGLVVRQMTEAPALRLKKDILEPMKHYLIKDKQRGPQPLRFSEGRALWRDSAALFRLHTKGYRPPLAFDWLAELVDEGYLDLHLTRRYLALGMSKKRAKVNFYRSERMPLPLRYLENRTLVDRLSEALEMAEGAARQLWGATRTLATFVLSPGADAEQACQPASKDLGQLTGQWAVDRYYWFQLEIPFGETMEALPEDVEAALTDWQETLKEAAWDAFDHVADHLSHDPRALKAVVCARGQLAAGLKKALPALGNS